MGFESINISVELSAKLRELGIETPTSIQQRAIPEALLGKNILVRSQTGSGKTLTYLLPLLQRLSLGQQALILAPTRELAQQIGGVVRSLSTLKCAVIYGGVEYEGQREALAQSPDIVVATVGRLKDLMDQGVAVVENIDYFILDEVDQMLDLGFREDILHLATLRSPSAQTLCFSATLPSLVEDIISEIIPASLVRIDNQEESLAVERIEQIGYYVTIPMMDHLLLHTLRSNPPKRGIIFTRSRKMADRISLLLRENEIFAEAIHSDRSQTAREHILRRFRSNETTLLVATDVIARGIDVEDVDVVYNYGLPLEAEQYIHRIGRTARAGRSGRAVTLCSPSEKPLVDRVCKLMRRHIAMSINHPYATPEIHKVLSGGGDKPRKRKK